MPSHRIVVLQELMHSFARQLPRSRGEIGTQGISNLAHGLGKQALRDEDFLDFLSQEDRKKLGVGKKGGATKCMFLFLFWSALLLLSREHLRPVDLLLFSRTRSSR